MSESQAARTVETLLLPTSPSKTGPLVETIASLEKQGQVIGTTGAKRFEQLSPDGPDLI